MRVARFEAGPWPSDPPGLLQRLLRRIVPLANPDLEPVYALVTNWWLEVDDGGLVTREIGFDPHGKAIAGAPLGSNHGIFTDLDGAPEPLGESVPIEDFERVWADVQARFCEGVHAGGLLD